MSDLQYKQNESEEGGGVKIINATFNLLVNFVRANLHSFSVE